MCSWSRDFETILVNTVQQDKSKYANHNYLHAVEARRLQDIMGVSEPHFSKIVAKNQLKNNPVVIDDIVATGGILSTSVKMLMGKILRAKMPHVPAIKIPLHIPPRYLNVILTGDIMNINKLHFLCV